MALQNERIHVMLSPKPWRDESQPLPELLEPGLCRLLPVGSGSLLLGNYEAELFFQDLNARN